MAAGPDWCPLCLMLVVCPPTGIAWVCACRGGAFVPARVRWWRPVAVLIWWMRRGPGAGRCGRNPDMPKIAEAARVARREQIIVAALACFARAGYHATTMADIAEQAGVSKGTPYLYFPGKEALFLALHEEWTAGSTA
jgi:hypothetical protein